MTEQILPGETVHDVVRDADVLVVATHREYAWIIQDGTPATVRLGALVRPTIEVTIPKALARALAANEFVGPDRLNQVRFACFVALNGREPERHEVPR